MKHRKAIAFFGLAAFLSIISLGQLRLFHKEEKTLKNPEVMTMEQRAEEAYQYAKRHKMNTSYAFLVDYSIPSGTPRLFVWDYEKNRVVAKTYVMHGIGGGSTKETPVFSNKPGSKCSSLGHFSVTKLHGSKIRRSFRLKGLDGSCSNAFRRGIMIHRSKWVDVWCKEKYIPLHEESCQGCITVSSKGMTYLEKLINSQSKPILLWSYV